MSSSVLTALLVFHFSFGVFAVVSAAISWTADQFPEEQGIEANGHFHGVQPRRYFVDLQINGPLQGGLDVEKPHYTGSVAMKFTPVLQNVSSVYFHAVDLSFSRAALKILDTEYQVTVKPTAFSYIQRVDLPFVLERYQEYDLVLNFTGFISWKAVGIFYRYDRTGKLNGTGQEHDGRRWAITTLFQMRHARQAFPCIDHPLMKATFAFCVTYRHGDVEGNVIIAGNTPAAATEERDGVKRACFEETPIISTYIVGFAVLGNYHAVRNVAQSVPVSVYYADPLQYSYSKDVAEKSSMLLGHLKDYFKLKYPLKQISFIVHQEMPDGILGIENFGLVSLNWGLPGDHIGLRVMTHEILHQWLGNTATLKSWREVCVQEGLVTFLDFLISNETLGTDIFKSFYRAKSAAFSRHELAEGRLLRHFDSVEVVVQECYARPPLIFSTIYEMAGPEGFRKFVRRYLKSYKFQNIGFNDILRTISQSVHPGVGQTLKSMFTEPGYPLLMVSQANSSKYVEVTVNLTTVLGDATVVSPRFEGDLPVQFFTSGQATRPVISLSQFPSTIGFEMDNQKSWLITDPRRMMYRVIYDKMLYDRIVAPCNASSEQCPPDELKRVAAMDLSWALQRRLVPLREDDSMRRYLWNIYAKLSQPV